MAIRIVRYRLADRNAWGVVEGADRLLPLHIDASSLAGVLAHGGEELGAMARAARPLPLADVELLSPVTEPCRVVCQGQNYVGHAREAGTREQARTFNQFFTKASSSLTGPRGPVVRPPGVRLLDYEVELGLVVGRSITAPVEITPANLHEYVGGFVLTNDISARDVQIPQGQWFKGKSYRTFCPVGPWVFVPEPGDTERIDELELRLWVNKELRQEGRAADMIYKPAETLTELSKLMDLAPGDLIMTGTPAGVALQAPGALAMRIAGLLDEATRMNIFVKRQLKRSQYLHDGDKVRAEIRTPDGKIDLGTQEFPIVSAG